MNSSVVPFVTMLSAAALASMTAGCSGSTTHAAVRQDNAPPRQDVVLACVGRVEGRSETVEVGAAADGVIEQLFVGEGQRIAKGQKLAEIACSDIRAGLQEAKSQAESTRHVRARLVRGAREEDGIWRRNGPKPRSPFCKGQISTWTG